MANLPTTMEYFDNLLGEQLTEGGGGSSDFSTAEVTIATTQRLGANYSLECNKHLGVGLVSAIINADGSLYTNADDNTVTINKPAIYNILFTKNGYIELYSPTHDNIAVEGDGEILS